MSCPICRGAEAPFASATVLRKYAAQYVRCGDCGYVRAADPHWLAEAYGGSAIATLDTGIVARNLDLAERTAALLAWYWPRAGACLDHGAGSGLLVRLLRDRGYDFRWRDPYCANLFARGFEAQPGAHYDLATAFEVIEHLADPLPTLAALAAEAEVLVLSSELLPATRNRPGEWHYYMLDSGQHIGFFSLPALQALARRLGLQLASDRRWLHVLGRRVPSPRFMRLLRKRRWRHWLLRHRRRATLAWNDQAALQARIDAATASDATP
ncbi:MAG: class I SAM-dependent methyltransferase [Metallibacterium scheffleri]|jgi:hypothetical protein|uniref:methyltransferase domain-containing protein n=1 Tax=Metallibacterium scheffleri TaxID=993689 RepID=UPI0026EC2D3E|nr:methyltransferase domain-containing protein [Metallibacterium scheffleri]MCK9366065.1 class I SAM-dependent methyltransferase [Metallibacterium scheffleri]